MLHPPGLRGRPLSTGVDGGAARDGGGAYMLCLGTSIPGVAIQRALGLSPYEAIWYMFDILVTLLGIRVHHVYTASRVSPVTRATRSLQIWVSEVVGGRGPATSSVRRERCHLLQTYVRGPNCIRYYMQAI